MGYVNYNYGTPGVHKLRPMNRANGVIVTTSVY